MLNRNLEKRIKDSYKNIAPDIFESILLDCDTQRGQIIVMKEKKEKRTFIKYATSMATVFMLIIGLVATYLYRNNRVIDSVVMLDVNPSIEIQVNKNENVLAVKPLNKEAQIVVGDMDFEGSKLDVTVNALIGSMLRNGYISDKANSILVTVNSNNPSTGQTMQAKLMSEINSVLESGNVYGAVLGQTVTNDKDVQKLAEQYGITVGKAKLIEQITTQNTFYSFEDLVSLSINELNLISESGGTKLENIESIGVASSSAYIGEQAAKDVAYTHAGIREEDVIKVKCELDWEKDTMVYEVDFDTVSFEYEYEINATTGEVVKSEKEKNNDVFAPLTPSNNSSKESKQTMPKEGNQASSNETYIGKDAAKKEAIKHAGVSEDGIYDYSCELDHEHGTMIYEINFNANGYEFDYYINALTGAVVKYEKEKDDDVKRNIMSEKQPEQTYIDGEEAKIIAINHAGVDVNNIYNFFCKLDSEDGRFVYEIEFKSDNYEYDYEIDAISGNVIKSEKEFD